MPPTETSARRNNLLTEEKEGRRKDKNRKDRRNKLVLAWYY